MDERVEEWLKKAENEFETAKKNFEISEEKAAAFFLQQSVEKALKAVKIQEEGSYSYSHDLLELSDEETRRKFSDTFAELNPVYTGVRYPDIDVQSIENLKDLIKDVEEVMEWTKNRLKESEN